MTGSIRFKTESLQTLQAQFFTTDGHLALIGIPKDQEADVQRDLTAIFNDAETPFTTAYAKTKIEAAGFEAVTGGVYSTPTYRCVRSQVASVPVQEGDGEPIPAPTEPQTASPNTEADPDADGVQMPEIPPTHTIADEPTPPAVDPEPGSDEPEDTGADSAPADPNATEPQ